MNALENLTGAKVYLHPEIEVFTTAKKIVVSCAAAAAITLLVVGILAVTNGMMPAAAAYALIGIGGAGVLADAIALAVFGYKHYQALKPLLEWIENDLRDDGGEASWTGFVQTLESSAATPTDQIKCYIKFQDLSGKYVTLIRTGDTTSIHLYENEAEWAMEAAVLNDTGYKPMR